MSLERRLRKLEVHSGVKPCPECGFVPGALPEEFEVSWPEEPEYSEGPEFCPECGDQTVYVVTWGDHTWRD